MPASEISSWLAFYSTHPPREVVERNEWALTRQLIARASGRFKDMPLEKFALTFGDAKTQSQEEIHRNLALVKRMLKNGNRSPYRKVAA